MGKFFLQSTVHILSRIRYSSSLLNTIRKEKDLRVTIRADMKVSQQFVITASKGNQIIGLIRRNITYKEKELIIPLNKAIATTSFKMCMQTWRPWEREQLN